MFSGGDSSEGINSINQLGAYGFVNQVAVSNAMAAGQNIDWAQLAQQWIQMRDNSAIEASANKISEPNCNNLTFEEKGEADMDMDDEEQTDEKTAQRASNDLTSAVHNSLNQPWFFSEAPRATSSSQWNPWPNREVMPQSNKNINNVSNRTSNPTAHIPSLLKMTVPHPNEIRVMPDIPNLAENTSNMMDAAKRKGLPAWIREGLEKMEREKQKQLEKEQPNNDNTNSSDEDNSPDRNILTKSLSSTNDGPIAVLDEESTDHEDINLTKSSNNEIDMVLIKENEEEETYSVPVGKTYEQQLADLMIVVRRTLTELLLEVTNEEISKVADETIKTFKSKASSAQVIRKSALSTLTGKLGLAAYGDSSSEDNSDDDDDEHNSTKKTTGQSESENDSEEEIRNIIRSKRRAFIKTSEDIDERVASAAAREEERLKYFLRKEEEEERQQNRKKQEGSLLREPSSSNHSGHNIFKGYEKDFGEITETKIQHLNGKRQRDRSSRRERTTRFSDNKDKYVALPNAATFLTNMNTAANSGTANNTTAALASNIQRQNIPDINGLLTNYTNAGMTNVLNAADAALEKVLKGKASSSPDKQSRRHDRDRNYGPSKKRQRTSDSKHSRSRSKSSSSSSSSSSSTSDSDSSSTSRSSHHSKYNHRSAAKHKSHTSTDRQYEKSHKDHKGDRKYSSSSYRKRDRDSTSSRYHRNASSDSEDEYRRRHKYDSQYSRNSSHSRSYASSRHDRDREHSRSQSRSSYSSSSNRRK